MSTSPASLTPLGLEVLVVADDPVLGRIAAALALVARRVAVAADGGGLLRQIWHRPPDVIVVADGGRAGPIPTLCEQVRQFLQTPILVVEEGASELERISWLDSGADDVLALQRSAPAELGARCAALLRRAQRQQRRDPGALRLHALGLQLDIAHRRLYLPDGQAVDVSASQLCLLALLFSRDGGVISGEAIAQHLAGSADVEALRRVAGLVYSLNRRCAHLEPRLFVERIHGRRYRLSLREAAVAQ